MSHHIAHVVEPTLGGVARHLFDLLPRLVASGLRISIYASFARRGSQREEFLALAGAGIAVREVDLPASLSSSPARKLAQLAEEDAVDILHAHSSIAGFHTRLALSHLRRRPRVVYTPHCFAFMRAGDPLTPLYSLVEWALARRTDRIICVSGSEREEAMRRGIPAAKLVEIANGIDLALWQPPTAVARARAREAWGIGSDELVIGALGRLVPQKGFDNLIEAAAGLLPEQPNARVLIWGGGPYRTALRARMRALSARRITFVGPTDHADMAYAAMDIFCSPSRWEGGPYTVLEAMASALPIVASDIPGHRDYLEDGATALLVPSEDPNALDGALRRLISDPGLAGELGAEARARVAERHRVEDMVATTVALYEEVLG